MCQFIVTVSLYEQQELLVVKYFNKNNGMTKENTQSHPMQ